MSSERNQTTTPEAKPLETLEHRAHETVRRAGATAQTLEQRARDTARRALDRFARIVASWAVSLNKLAEALGPAPASEPEHRDGVVPEVPAA